jgi:VIT1/CCC1 family predicted Fe2+/Mn2+ transporter
MSIRTSFVNKYLDQGASLGEVLFGLIMTLTFTLGAGITIQEEGAEGARELLIATVGCNIAWGVIDGIFYVLGQLFERGRRRRVVQLVRGATRDTDAAALVAGELDDVIEKVMTPDERQRLYGRIVAQVRAGEIPPNPITRDDVMGGIASFWLVFFASLPAAIPFLFIDDARLALRVSNAVLLALLFIAGFHWARYTTARPIVTGLVFLVFGAALVAMTIALGG